MGYTEIASLKLSTIFTSYQETEFLLLNLRTQLELKRLKRAFKNHLSFCLDRIKLFVFLAERSFHSFLSSEIAFLVQVFRTGCEAAGKKTIVFLHRSTESMSKRWSHADWHEVSSSPSPSTTSLQRKSGTTLVLLASFILFFSWVSATFF